jgi:Fe-S-cluster containining protein
MEPADSASTPTREWYAGGLRFECTKCGNCCTGPPGWVWFDQQEGRKIAARLGLDETEFYKRYAHQVDGRWSLKETRSDRGYDCIFLDRTSRPGEALCSIYDLRPTQCRTWPFWPENLSSPRAWQSARRRTPCPGMENGALVPVEQIRIQRDRTP